MTAALLDQLARHDPHALDQELGWYRDVLPGARACLDAAREADAGRAQVQAIADALERAGWPDAARHPMDVWTTERAGWASPDHALSGAVEGLHPLYRTMRLRLIDPPDADPHEALAQLAALTTLRARTRRVELHGLGQRAAAALAEQSGWDALDTLTHVPREADLSTLHTLAGWQAMRGLKALELCLYTSARADARIEALTTLLRACPELRALRLSFSARMKLGEAHARALIDALPPHLTTLELGSGVHLHGKGQLAVIEALSTRAITDLSLCEPLTAATTRALLRADASPLERLHLHHTALTDAQVQALMTLPFTRRLRALDLPSSALSARGVLSVLDAPAHHTLERLHLPLAELDETCAARLASPAHTPTLRRVDIQNRPRQRRGGGARLAADLSVETIEALLARRVMPTPRALSERAEALRGWHTRSAEAGGEVFGEIFGRLREALHRAPSIEGFVEIAETLDRAHQLNPSRCAEALAPHALDVLSRRWPDALRWLPTRAAPHLLATPPEAEALLSRAELLHQAIAADPTTPLPALLRALVLTDDQLLHHEHLQHVRALCLTHTTLDAQLAALLAEHPALATLDQLTLTRVLEINRHHRALTDAPWWPRLRALRLTRTALGIRALTSMWRAAPALERLTLHAEPIGPRAVTLLTEDPSAHPSLRVLELYGCRLTDAHARDLAAWPGLASVEALDLRANGISADGLDALLASAHLHPQAHICHDPLHRSTP